MVIIRKKVCCHIKLLVDIEPIIECQSHRTVFFIPKHGASRIWDKLNDLSIHKEGKVNKLRKVSVSL